MKTVDKLTTRVAMLIALNKRYKETIKTLREENARLESEAVNVEQIAEKTADIMFQKKLKEAK